MKVDLRFMIYDLRLGTCTMGDGSAGGAPGIVWASFESCARGFTPRFGADFRSGHKAPPTVKSPIHRLRPKVLEPVQSV